MTFDRVYTPEQSAAWHPDHPGGSTDILPFYEWLAERIPHGASFLEVGCFFGRNTSYMALRRHDLHIICCDPHTDDWEDAGETLSVGPDRELRDKCGGLHEAFRLMLKKHAPGAYDRIEFIREPSADGLKRVRDASVWACFLDGDHSYDGLTSDIDHALRITTPGGIISGHDYHVQHWGSATTRAVRDALLFRRGAKGYKLAPWPVDREGWEPGHSSVWYADEWIRSASDIHGSP